MNTNTPRTDEQEFNESGGFDVDWPDFARTLETELARVTAERDELIAWREAMISVSPPLQEIGRELGLTVGESIYDKILPGIQKIKAELEKLKNQTSR